MERGAEVSILAHGPGGVRIEGKSLERRTRASDVRRNRAPLRMTPRASPRRGALAWPVHRVLSKYGGQMLASRWATVDVLPL
jgi:hypothetical protein